jgi:hypothetical protein
LIIFAYNISERLLTYYQNIYHPSRRLKMLGKREQPKEKKLSAKELKKLAFERIVKEVGQLAPGDKLIYKVPSHCQIYDACFLIVELNPSFPGKGKKYQLFTDTIVDGKPSGKQDTAFDTNKPLDYANWVLDRSGERFI